MHDGNALLKESTAANVESDVVNESRPMDIMMFVEGRVVDRNYKMMISGGWILVVLPRFVKSDLHCAQVSAAHAIVAM